MKSMSVFLVMFVCVATFAQQPDSLKKGKLLFSDDFSSADWQKNWRIECEDNGNNAWSIIKGQLELNTKGGITLWYKNKLSGSYLIEYDRTVLMQGGANDRLSDLNQFWMATDPAQKMFSRKGGFREYDSLRMYYVGMGGNYNTTTRMRRYNGNGQLKIVGEFTDSAHLLQPNRLYHIAVLVKANTTKFFVNGEEYFSFTDSQPLTEGWFAIRSTKSRQRIDNVKIFSLADN